MSTLLTIKNLSKAYGPQVVFNDASLHIHAKQKIGVIGRNGAGKSTLFKMIMGFEEWDQGELSIHENSRIGYLEQHDYSVATETVLDILEKGSGQELWQCAKVAGAFGLKQSALAASVGTLSGGFQMRVKLALMLLKDPNLFLLDEPTNYLDVHTQLLLEQFLKNYSGAFLVISHDREFLNRTCTETLEVERGKLVLYPGTVEDYLAAKEERLAFEQLYNKKIEREQKHLQTFVDRFRYKASKARQAQSKLKAIARLEKINIDSPLAEVRITIPRVEAKKGLLLRVQNLAIGYAGKTVAKDICIDIDRGEHVAIIGDNGQGKTTLLKTLADVLPSLAGSFRWAYDTALGYYAQHVPEGLDQSLTAWQHIRCAAPLDINDEDVLRMAGNFLFNKDTLEKKIAVLSGGERARLSLAGILLSRCNVLVLDEPTNHLDFETVEALGRALNEFNGTVFFVSHNRTLVNSIATTIIEVGQGEVRRYPGTYEEYVWHLEQLVEQGEEEPQRKVAHGEGSPRDTEARNEELKKTKKELHKVEETVAEFHREKLKLERKQAKNPLKFTPADYAELGQVTVMVQKKEEEWFVLQERILALNKD